MHKIVISHNTNNELEMTIGNSLKESIGEDFLEYMVIKVEDGLEVIYSLLDDAKTKEMTNILSYYGIEIISVENCERSMYDLYFNNKIDSFLSAFKDYDTDGFVNNFYSTMDVDFVLDKILSSGVQALNLRDQQILNGV